MTDKLIRLRDALAIVEEYVGLYDAIADLPAVTVGVDAVLDAAHEYLTQQYGASPLCHPIDRARIFAALEPVAAPPVTPKVKPLDLSYVQKHAFLAGVVAARNVPPNNPCSGPLLWLDYDPGDNPALARILALIQKGAAE